MIREPVRGTDEMKRLELRRHAIRDPDADRFGGAADADRTAHAAWRALADRDVLTEADAARFMTDLAWLSEALERVFPKARAFVRPGFDEPDEVARLRAREQRPWRSAS